MSVGKEPEVCLRSSFEPPAQENLGHCEVSETSDTQDRTDGERKDSIGAAKCSAFSFWTLSCRLAPGAGRRYHRSMMTKRAWLTFLVGLSLPFFDCARPKSDLQRFICANVTLLSTSGRLASA